MGLGKTFGLADVSDSIRRLIQIQILYRCRCRCLRPHDPLHLGPHHHHCTSSWPPSSPRIGIYTSSRPPSSPQQTRRQRIITRYASSRPLSTPRKNQQSIDTLYAANRDMNCMSKETPHANSMGGSACIAAQRLLCIIRYGEGILTRGTRSGNRKSGGGGSLAGVLDGNGRAHYHS